MSITVIEFDISDGDGLHRPGPSSGREPATPDELLTYRSKVGEFVAPSLDSHDPDFNYRLKTLPDGYALYRYTRPKSGKHVDKFLYGHPSHYIFNSTKDFKPHAIWLLHDQEGQCNCNGCKKSGGQPRLAAAKEPKRVGRPPKGTSRSASDGSNKGLGSGRTLREKPTAAQMAGNESIFTKLMTKLKREGEVDEMIRDPENIAFKIEQHSFASDVTTLVEQQPSLLFRLGELVLFQFPTKKTQDGASDWRAGLVVELPHSSTPTLEELTSFTSANLAINYTGYRVELMSDPNSHNKAEQQQWCYLPETSMRPFQLYPYLIDESQPDKSFSGAMKCLTSFSLALPTKFIGQWPDAHILFKGMYFGAELLVVGDFVDLLPTQSPSIENQATTLKIASIVLKFTGLEPDPGSNTHVTGDVCEVIEVRLHGRLFSPKSEDSMQVDNEGLSHLHALYPEDKVHSLPLSLISGKHIPPDNLAAFDLPDLGATSFTSNTTQAISRGLQEGRKWARQNDDRILKLNEDVGGDLNAEWWWANDRVEALGIDRFGENDVGEGFERYLAKERMAYEG